MKRSEGWVNWLQRTSGCSKVPGTFWTKRRGKAIAGQPIQEYKRKRLRKEANQNLFHHSMIAPKDFPDQAAETGIGIFDTICGFDCCWYDCFIKAGSQTNSFEFCLNGESTVYRSSNIEHQCSEKALRMTHTVCSQTRFGAVVRYKLLYSRHGSTTVKTWRIFLYATVSCSCCATWAAWMLGKKTSVSRLGGASLIWVEIDG